MRVVHVINGLTTGGAETVLYRLATYPSDVEHEVICLERRASYSGRLEEKGIAVHHLDWTVPGASPRAWMRLRRLIKDSSADVVQAWMYRSNLLAGIAGRSAGIPVVWNIRCSSVKLLRPATRVLARLGGMLAGWMPARTINCSAASAEFHARLGYNPERVTVIPNGYDPQDFHPDEETRTKVRSELGIGPDVFLVGNFGRWEREKGCSVLLRALASLSGKGIALRVLLIGPGLGSSNAKLMQLIEESGCADLVEAVGERRDVAAVAQALDLHVLPSLTEGFPNVVAETMLSGTPNVGTDVGDTKLIIGDTGWVVPPSDPEELAAAIESAQAEWSSAPVKWRSRQAAARNRIAENFSLAAMVRRYEEVWDEAATGRPAQALLAAAPAGEDTATKPLRVVHIINKLTLGGAEALLYRLVTRDALNEHVIVSLGGPAWYSERLREHGLPVHHLGIETASSLPRGVRHLRRLIRDSDADVVQCWMYHSNFIGGLAAKSQGKPVVWGVHNTSLEPVRRRSRALVYLSGLMAGRAADFIINCSVRSADLHSKLGFNRANGAVVHNGYDATAFFPDDDARARAREALDLDPEAFAIGSIARWDPLKDIPNLLAALPIARDRGVPVRCFLIGAGLRRANLRLTRELERLGCADLVVPLGPRGDVQDLARAIDLHVLASRTEAFPNVVAETMLSGTPNVVADVGDSAVMVGDTGWVVPARDPESLADAIVDAYREWKDKPDEWADRRAAARSRIAENFSIDGMMAAYEAIWKDVAAGRRPQSPLNPTAVQ